MWSTLWFNINLANVSDANGGPLSVVKLLGVSYCEKSCVNLCVMVSTVFVEILKVKGYLLNVKNQQQGLAKGLLVHPLGSLVEYAG